MNDEVAKQLARQLKVLNFWITLFGTLFLISLLIIGFLLFKVVSFTQNTADKVDGLQDKVTKNLNVQEKLCNTDSVGGLLKDKTDSCN